jgi:hypothetical protein
VTEGTFVSDPSHSPAVPGVAHPGSAVGGCLRTAEVSMTLTFLDPRTGRLVTIKVPDEPPLQPQHPVMRPSR